jgi:predicted N-acetyltransferase YhbS
VEVGGMAVGEGSLGENLVLRCVRDESDVARLVDMYTRAQNAVEGRTAASLLGGHGRLRREEYLLVEDLSSGGIVSTTCLIPWTLRFCGIPFSCAQVEMVYTSPSHRNRGLVRRQFERLHSLARGAGYDILVIWGIPFYYRQFGYSYAIEGCTTETLSASGVPGAAGSDVRFRPATEADIPALRGFHDGLSSRLDVRIDRGEEHWRYMIDAARQPVLVVERGGREAGYLLASPLGGSVRVLENGIADQETALGVLGVLAREHGEIAVRWPRQSPLVTAAQGLGSVRTRSAQWLIRIPDLPAFLAKLRPELDRRLAASAPGVTNRRFLLNLYREAVSLAIRDGRVAEVQGAGPVDTSMGGSGAALSIPPDAFVKLLFGEAGVDELYSSWPDTVVKAEDKAIVQALFPRLDAYLSTPYHAYGPGFDAMDDGLRALYL